MQFTCRKATREDLPRLAEIEKKSVSGGYYLVDCYDEFLDPARGELVVGVDENGVPQGFGHVALLHDGSAWLECLRVDPAAQKMGCGAAMWVRFVSYCKEKGCSHLGMFTGAKNYPSKVLAERNGLHLDYTSREGSLLREDASQVTLPQGWTRLTDPAAIEKAMLPHQKDYEGYLSLNRTYMRTTGKLYEYLAEKQQVWVKESSVVVLGARFLPERALFIGWAAGDLEECAALAVAKFLETGLPKLTCICSSQNTALMAALEKQGFTFPSELIVLERDF